MSTSSRTQRRTHARKRVEFRVEIRADGRTQVLTVARNISMGGLFLEMAPPWPVGPEVALCVHLPTGSISCKGRIAWSSADAGEPGWDGRRGVGVELSGLGMAEWQALAEAIAQLPDV